MAENTDPNDVSSATDEWADFLASRHRLILRWKREGRSAWEVSQTLSMDVTQVLLIAATPIDSPGPRTVFGELEKCQRLLQELRRSLS